MLRLLCEAAQYPLHSGGFLGDIFGLLLTPFHVLEYLDEYYEGMEDGGGASDYVTAQRDGWVGHNCTAYQRKCNLDFFKVIDYMVNAIKSFCT